MGREPAKSDTDDTPMEETNETTNSDPGDIAPMDWIINFTMTDISNLKSKLMPWYCMHGMFSHYHDTTTLEAMNHSF